jgi:hypothetical protein
MDFFQSLEYLEKSKVAIVKEMNFKATVAIPVIYNDILMAILEFRATEERPKKSETLSFMTTVATRSLVSSALLSRPVSIFIEVLFMFCTFQYVKDYLTKLMINVF